jgi:hypothetical protein
MGGEKVPAYLRHTLKIELERDEIVALLGHGYAKLVEELRLDIANIGDASEAEQAAVDNPSLDELLRHAPDHLGRLLEVYLWGDLEEMMFGRSEESQWEYVADNKLEAVSVARNCQIVATAYPIPPLARDD